MRTPAVRKRPPPLSHVGSSAPRRIDGPNYEPFSGEETGGTVALWLWILLGIVGVFAISFLAALMMAAILSNIGRESSELIELELLPSSQPTDSSDWTPATVLEGRAARRSSGVLLE